MLRAGVLIAAGLSLAACAAVEPNPQQSASYADYLIGRVANSREDFTVAADRYFSALTRAPGDDALLRGALIASLASGDEARARRAARLAPREDAPGYAHLVRAADALTARRWGQADASLNRVEGVASEELMARLMAVWTRVAQGRIADVVAELGPLASVRPYGGLFAYQQAMAFDYAVRPDDALAAYEIGADSGMWLPAGVERHADLLVRRGRRDAAIALLDTPVNQANPALAAALARVRAGGAAAAAPLTPAIGASVALYGLAAILIQEADSTNALAALTLSLMLDPSADSSRLAFAQQQTRLGHVALAQAALARVPETSPYFGSARIMQAWALLDAGHADAALALARENAAGGDARALRTLADMHRSRGEYAEAEPLYSRLIEQQPQEWRLFFARGAARERLGRWPEAEADFQRALQLSPDQPDVLNYLGYTWVDRGERLEEGLALIQRAAALRPQSGEIIDSLGWAYYRMGDFARAVDLLEHAVELEPADPILNDHLGDAYWRLGRRTEARYQWRRALTQEPDDPAAIQAKIENGLPPLPAPPRTAQR
ncbi:MAG: tetratricopeptide repeat protein [Hyphomonadaceae bacterium]